MGMYAYHQLRVCDRKTSERVTKEEMNHIMNDLYNDREADPKSMADYALDLDGDLSDTAPWYSFEDTFCKFSKKYPHLLFIFRMQSAEPEFVKEGSYFYYFKDGQTGNISKYAPIVQQLDFDEDAY